LVLLSGRVALGTLGILLLNPPAGAAADLSDNEEIVSAERGGSLPLVAILVAPRKRHAVPGPAFLMLIGPHRAANPPHAEFSGRLVLLSLLRRLRSPSAVALWSHDAPPF